WARDGVRGEITVVVEGAPVSQAAVTEDELARDVADRERAGEPRKAAIAAVALRAGVPKRRVYAAVLAAKRS
ncbi:MAG TPA: 16S rRNA (cytidine(1402)-2'-O)-methyltransferase, partial [Actinomycetes bacterium]|nr:16S rRNA (cytidine(1402)-2'-O)-methyltransferase [Actinomycetes bacterium]